jgi:pSer/pThr/pTyr-binding forkhead associated (FHA) protein
LHALLERVAGGWIVQDLGSRNGTFVNGVRVTGPRALRGGDELRIGVTRLLFQLVEPPEELTSTTPLAKAPSLTPREHDALVALCRPILVDGLMSQPASVLQIAKTLVVTESAAKKLLARLYDRFELQGDDRRRGRLAMHALQSGAVSTADLR